MTGFQASVGVRLTLPFSSISSTTTSISWPSVSTSSTLLIRLPLPSLLMCTRPSRPGRMLTKAPNLVMLTTRPGYTLPTSAIGGDTMFWMRALASSIRHASTAPMVTMPWAPSSSTAMSAPVSCTMVLMTLPFGPMTSPILSIGMVIVMIFGAVAATSARGSARQAFMLARISMRASLAWSSAAASTSAGMPSILVSSWRAVIASAVPATLKSMSPKASSAPRMSVSVVYLPSA